MPIGEIAGEVLGGALKAIGRVLVEIIFEICIKGLGYLVCKPFTRTVNPDGVLVVMVGFIIWALLLLALYFGYEFISVRVEIDRCLDSGGRYNDEIGQCHWPSA